jgi:hypothetical protein
MYIGRGRLLLVVIARGLPALLEQSDRQCRCNWNLLEHAREAHAWHPRWRFCYLQSTCVARGPPARFQACNSRTRPLPLHKLHIQPRDSFPSPRASPCRPAAGGLGGPPKIATFAACCVATCSYEAAMSLCLQAAVPGCCPACRPQQRSSHATGGTRIVSGGGAGQDARV